MFRGILARAGRTAERNRDGDDEPGNSSKSHVNSFATYQDPEQE
jgi:hypothetical protein